MTLVSMPNLLAEAEKGGYALGYFEAWNLESLEAVMDAAEESRSPVILGFGGGFLENPHRVDLPHLELYAALGLAAARTITVPVCLLLNEILPRLPLWLPWRAPWRMSMPRDWTGKNLSPGSSSEECFS